MNFNNQLKKEGKKIIFMDFTAFFSSCIKLIQSNIFDWNFERWMRVNLDVHYPNQRSDQYTIEAIRYNPSPNK